MSKRERIIMALVAGFVAIGFGYLVVHGWLLKPAATYNERIASHRKDLKRLNKANNREPRFRKRIETFLSRTHAGTYDAEGDATRRLAAQRLGELAIGSNLPQESLDLVSFTGGADVDGRYREIGWSVRTRGTLAELTNFLYLLKSQPQVYRIDNIDAEPDWETGKVDLRFKYVTLALSAGDEVKTKDEAKGKTKDEAKDEVRNASATDPATQPAPTPAADPIRLDTPERKLYDAIASRDLFRPYIKQTPPPPVRPTPKPPTPKPVTLSPKPCTDQYFRVVGLTNWTSDVAAAAILITDSRNKQTVEHAIGDDLADGKIVAVDYRPLPMPDEAEILSPSRVIVEIGSDHWAIELGHTLAQKRKLSGDDVPMALRTNDEPEDSPTLEVSPSTTAGPPAEAAENGIDPVEMPPRVPTEADLLDVSGDRAGGLAERLAMIRRQFQSRTLALNRWPSSGTPARLER